MAWPDLLQAILQENSIILYCTLGVEFQLNWKQSTKILAHQK